MLFDCSEILLDGIVDAEVDNFEPGTLHHHADQIFADVVNVALYSADNHLADAGRPGGDQQRLQNGHARLHGVRRQQHLRHEQNSIAEIDADYAHAFHKSFGQNLVGRPPALEKNSDSNLNLLFEAIVKIVVHLLGQLFIVQRPQIKFITAHVPSPKSGSNRRIAQVIAVWGKNTPPRRDAGQLDYD